MEDNGGDILREVILGTLGIHNEGEVELYTIGSIKLVDCVKCWL